MTGARRLAATTENRGPSAASAPSVAVVACTRSRTRLRSALALTTSGEAGSMSVARTDAAPQRAAPTARTPLPQPASSTVAPSSTRSASRARTRRVVGCEPDPKVGPGSIHSTSSPAASSGASTQGGVIQNRPARSGTAHSRQPSRPSSSTGAEAAARPRATARVSADAASAGSAKPPDNTRSPSTVCSSTPAAPEVHSTSEAISAAAGSWSGSMVMVTRTHPVASAAEAVTGRTYSSPRTAGRSVRLQPPAAHPKDSGRTSSSPRRCRLKSGAAGYGRRRCPTRSSSRPPRRASP